MAHRGHGGEKAGVPVPERRPAGPGGGAAVARVAAVPGDLAVDEHQRPAPGQAEEKVPVLHIRKGGVETAGGADGLQAADSHGGGPDAAVDGQGVEPGVFVVAEVPAGPGGQRRAGRAPQAGAGAVGPGPGGEGLAAELQGAVRPRADRPALGVHVLGQAVGGYGIRARLQGADQVGEGVRQQDVIAVDAGQVLGPGARQQVQGPVAGGGPTGVVLAFQAYPRVLAGELEGDVSGPVGGTVVDHQGPPASIALGPDRGQGFLEVELGVISGDDDGHDGLDRLDDGHHRLAQLLPPGPPARRAPE